MSEPACDNSPDHLLNSGSYLLALLRKILLHSTIVKDMLAKLEDLLHAALAGLCYTGISEGYLHHCIASKCTIFVFKLLQVVQCVQQFTRSFDYL